MNNQVKLDKDKVIDYIEERLKYVDDAEELYQLQCKIENGYFDTTPPVPTIKPNWIKYDRNNPPDEGDYLVSDGTYWEKGFMVRTNATFWSVPERGDILCGDDVKYYARVGVDPLPTIKPGDKVKHKHHDLGIGEALNVTDNKYVSVLFPSIYKLCLIADLEVVE